MVSLRRKLFALVAAGLLSVGVVTAFNQSDALAQATSVSLTMKGKDVVADVLPPPIYLIELRLVLGMAMDGSMPLAQAQSEQARLIGEYQERIAHWQAHLPPELAGKLMGEQRQHAQKFMAASNRVLEALKAQSPWAAKQALLEAHGHYVSHRSAVDQTVQMATAFASRSAHQYEASPERMAQLGWSLLTATAIALTLFGTYVMASIWREAVGKAAGLARIANPVADADCR